jgi:ubiquitin-protein ligase E3 C
MIDKEMSVNLQRETVPIRRQYVMEDGFAKLNPLGNYNSSFKKSVDVNFVGSRMKGGIRILFISELGMEEAGIDGGGVFKEFLTE